MKTVKQFGLFMFTACTMLPFTACSSDILDEDSSEKNKELQAGKVDTGNKDPLYVLKVNNLSDLGIPHGSYSGITKISDSEYTIVDDHALYGGLYTLNIDWDLNTGEIKKATRTAFEGTTLATPEDAYGGDKNWADPEGVIYHPSTNTYFVAGERFSTIWEYDRKGYSTGRKIDVPEAYDVNHIWEAFGFESLAYNKNTQLFWTCTEKALLADVAVKSKPAQSQHKIHFQSFDEDLKASKQYLYETDAYDPNSYTHGVSEILALDNGKLLVLERELLIYTEGLAEEGIQYISPKDYKASNRIYMVDPTQTKEGETLKKTKLLEINTLIDALKPSLADYEGMCLGPKLKDGRQTVLLLADTQNGMGGSLGSITLTLQEYLTVLVLNQ